MEGGTITTRSDIVLRLLKCGWAYILTCMMEGYREKTPAPKPNKVEDSVAWKEKMAALDAYGNNKEDDVPIDENIKECTVALNMLGIHTTASCGGHIEGDRNSFPMMQGILEDDAGGNSRARKEVGVLLDTFNKGQNGENQLELLPEVTEGYRIVSVSERAGLEIEGSEEPADKEKHRELVVEAQKTFQEFTDFLKNKFEEPNFSKPE